MMCDSQGALHVQGGEDRGLEVMDVRQDGPSVYSH